ncbi:Ig-like domain-containing protein [Alloalcanivorax sp. C16-1]|uniref:Ig-like domain-containing protein n=1 Tax=Alloalcanivorax sp. C16-1 TaxID=3390051 RepID=UPI003970D9C4
MAVALPAAILLVACGGDSSSPSGSDGQAAQNSLIYSFPLQDQQEVPTPTPVVLRFSQSVSGMGLENDVVLRHNGDAVPAQGRLADGGKSLILTPASKLDYHADYVVDLPDNVEINGAQDIRFSTRAAEEGIKANVIADDTLDVMRTLPSGGEQDPMMDFSTIRMQFTQPLDQQTVRYGQGGNNTLRLVDGDDNVVPAWVVVDGPYLTVDPKEDLTPGETYRLVFENNGVQSTYGESFAFANGNRFRFNPASSLAEGTDPSERPQPLVQRITTPGDQGTGNGLSPLTGEEINKIPVNAVLLGDSETTNMAATQQEGDVLGDLAFLPRYPRVSPLRIRRGTLLTGSSIDVKIGGEVEAGFDSGEVRVHFLSDANGYLIPNIYDPEGPRMVRLFMDVAMSTEDAIANGGVTQNITHLELIGTVSTDTGAGVIDINAVGVVEPMILGLERGYGTLSFQLQTYRDQTPQLVDQVRQQQNDTVAPELQSWTMGDNILTGDNKAVLAKPGDPIILNFDEPIEPGSIEGKVHVFDATNQEMDIRYHVDGAAVVIQLKETTQENGESTKVTQPGFQLSPAENPNVYRVEVDGATDLAGNMAVGMPLIEQFELATIVPDYDLTDPEVSPFYTPADTWIARRQTTHAPVILAAYPGFPCALLPEFLAAGGNTGLFGAGSAELTDIGQTYRDLANGVAGMCAGAAPAITEGTERENRPADDRIPVMDMPSNWPIIVAFGKEIDPATVVLGETFKVERIDENEQVLGEVDGTVEMSDMTLRFQPAEPWQADELYRYTLKSSGWALCRTGINPDFRMVANDATEINGCGSDGSSSTIVASSDHRAFECGVDAICDNEGLPLRTMPLGTSTARKRNPNSTFRKYNEVTYGPSITAGGPEMVQFFRGAMASSNVLQVLRTQPVADTNRNFASDRSNLGAGDDDIPELINFFVMNTGGDPESSRFVAAGEFDFDIEEYGPAGPLQAGDPGYGLYPDYDPGGVKPAKNSAKILSRYDSQGPALALSGANVGCSYDSEFDIGNFTSSVGTPFECPENKFTYLISAAIAEVTDEVDANGRVKVKLWPSIVMGTSLDFYIDTNVFGAVFYAAGTLSGPQVLRMRYEGANSNEPVTGWISEQGQGPVLGMDMNLYVDAPYAFEWDPITNPGDLKSYEIGMSLEGGVTFLDDGRMEVEQYNTNAVDLFIDVWDAGNGNNAGYLDLFIPEYGNRINMISEPIK